MADKQHHLQHTNGGQGRQVERQGNTAPGRAELVLSPHNAAISQHPKRDEGPYRPTVNSSAAAPPTHPAEMLQRRPVYNEWDDTEFLPLRMRDLPPKPAPAPPAAALAAQRLAANVPFVQQQDLRVNVVPPRQSFPVAAVKPAVKPKEMIRTGFETYKIISKLQNGKPGTGGMSNGVFLVRTKENKQYVAKLLEMDSKDKRERAEAEKQALQQFKEALRTPHANVNSIREAFLPEKANEGVLILEYCDEGSLAAGIDQMRAGKTQLKEDLAFHFLYGIAKGLAMIHHGIPDHTDESSRIHDWKSICHLDIKPANILIDRRGKETRFPRVVIADFGCSATSDDVVHARERRVVQEYGTPGWYPPEEPSNSPGNMVGRYGKPTDVWQAGGVIQTVCLLMCQPDMTVMTMPLGRKYGPELNCIVAMCLGADYQRRPTAIDLCRELRAIMKKKGIPV